MNNEFKKIGYFKNTLILCILIAVISMICTHFTINIANSYYSVVNNLEMSAQYMGLVMQSNFEEAETIRLKVIQDSKSLGIVNFLPSTKMNSIEEMKAYFENNSDDIVIKYKQYSEELTTKAYKDEIIVFGLQLIDLVGILFILFEMLKLVLYLTKDLSNSDRYISLIVLTCITFFAGVYYLLIALFMLMLLAHRQSLKQF